MATYYFNASNSGPTDSSASWTNDANGFDSALDTYASCATDSKSILAGGTNSPTTELSGGQTILSVKARIWGYFSGDGASAATFSSYINLSIPNGGWTFQKVNGLEVTVTFFDGVAGFVGAELSAIIKTNGAVETLGTANLDGISKTSGQTGFLGRVEVLVIIDSIPGRIYRVQGFQ